MPWRILALLACILCAGCASRADLRVRAFRTSMLEDWKKSETPEDRYRSLRSEYYRKDLDHNRLPGSLATASEDHRAFIDTYFSFLAEVIVQLNEEMDRAWNEGRYATAAHLASRYLRFEGSSDAKESFVEDHLPTPAKGTRLDIARHIVARYEQMFPVIRWADGMQPLPNEMSMGIVDLWRSRSAYRRKFRFRDREAFVAAALMSGTPVIEAKVEVTSRAYMAATKREPSSAQASATERMNAPINEKIAQLSRELDSLRQCSTSQAHEITSESYAHKERDGRMTYTVDAREATHVKKTTVRFGGDTVCRYIDPYRAQSIQNEMRGLAQTRKADPEPSLSWAPSQHLSFAVLWTKFKMGEKTGAEDSEGELRGSPEDQRKRLPTAVNRLFEKSLVKFATQLDPPWLGKLSSAVSPTDRKREIELFRESFNHFDAKDEITYGGGDIQTLVKLGKLPPG